MKKVVILLTLVIAIAFIGSAMAVPPGKTVEFDTPMGKVTFDGKTHADAGNKCNDCHTKIFKMKKGSFEMKSPHPEGEFCFTCHNGEKAFAQKDNCQKCHVK